jgi:hypothetical protein
MQPITANDVDLSNFNPLVVNYGPKDLHATAAKVTEDNIGKFAIEFELDVRYPFPNGTGISYLEFMADRTADEPIELTLYPGCWVVTLWGEIHVFKDGLFQKTFDIETVEELPKKEVDWVNFNPQDDARPWDPVRDEIENGGTKIIPKVGDIFDEEPMVPPGPGETQGEQDVLPNRGGQQTL